jgi:Flp pilus assembly protein TadG
MIRFQLKCFWKSTRGASLAEAAIALPLLVLMLGAAAEFGRYIYYYNTLDKATRASARYISTRQLDGTQSPPTNFNEAKNIAVYGEPNPTNTSNSNKVLGDSNFTTSRISISPTSGTPPTVTVSITGYTYTPIFAFGPMANLVSFSIQPSTTMKYLVNTPTE